MNHWRSSLARALLIGSGSLCIALGFVGIFVPVLPTTPILLLAAVCYARSSPRFYHWLLTNRWFGEYVRNYRQGRGIPLREKRLALLALWLTIGFTTMHVVSAWWSRLILLAVAAGVTVHLLRVKTFEPKTRSKTAQRARPPENSRRGARMITEEEVVASEAARNSPAAVPATIEEIKARLARELGLVCKFDGIVWGACESWLCEEPSGDGLAFLYLTSRRGAPNEVGRISASVPRTDCHRARSFLGSVVALAAAGADSRLAEEWVAKTVPCLNETRAMAETVADGIRFVLSIPWGNWLQLDFGDLE